MKYSHYTAIAITVACITAPNSFAADGGEQPNRGAASASTQYTPEQFIATLDQAIEHKDVRTLYELERLSEILSSENARQLGATVTNQATTSDNFLHNYSHGRYNSWNDVFDLLIDPTNLLGEITNLGLDHNDDYAKLNIIFSAILRSGIKQKDTIALHALKQWCGRFQRDQRDETDPEYGNSLHNLSWGKFRTWGEVFEAAQ